jgi:hypothetical protein
MQPVAFIFNTVLVHKLRCMMLCYQQPELGPHYTPFPAHSGVWRWIFLAADECWESEHATALPHTAHSACCQNVSSTLLILIWCCPIFKYVHKTVKNNCQLRHDCLSIRPSAWNNLAPTGQIFMKFGICGFLKMCHKVHVLLNLTRITGTLHEDLHNFIIIFHIILLRVRNVSDKICREIKTHNLY